MILLTKNLIVRMFDFCSMINTLSTNFFCIYKLLSNPGEKTLVRLAKEKKKRKKHYMTIFLIGCESPLMAPTEFKVKNTKRKEIKKIISRCQWQNDHGLLVTNLIFFLQIFIKLKINLNSTKLSQILDSLPFYQNNYYSDSNQMTRRNVMAA